MNLTQLHKQFGTQRKCLKHLEQLRWGNEPICPQCLSTESITKRKTSMEYHCNDCNKDFSVINDTIFEETRLPLPKFFTIMYLMNNAKMGISAAEIARAVGVRYETAWYACHRIRCAMVEKELKLEGVIEFDEMYLGKKPGKKFKSDADNIANQSTVTVKRGRGTNKVPIVGAVEKKGKVHLKIIKKLTSRNLLAMLKEAVNVDESIVITDDFKSYRSFDSAVEHITIKHSEGYGKGIKTVNTIEGLWSLIKNGIKGSYRSISKKYLPFYMAEWSYKFNNRHLQKDSFAKLLENSVSHENKMIKFRKIYKDAQTLNGLRL